MKSRRKLVKGAFGLISLGTVNTVNGKENEKAGEEEKDDFNEEIQNVLHKDGPDAVKQLFERNGLNCEVSTTHATVEQDDSSDVGLETQYPEDESNVTSILGGSGTDGSFYFTTYVELRGSQTRLSTSMNVDDVISIVYDENDWSIVGTPSVNADYDWDGHDVDEPLTVNFTSDSFNNGLSARVDVEKVNDGNPQMPELVDGTVSLMTQFENETGTASPVLAAYEHTGAPTTSGSVVDISADASLLSFDVELGGGASEIWNVGEPRDPKDFTW